MCQILITNFAKRVILLFFKLISHTLFERITRKLLERLIVFRLIYFFIAWLCCYEIDRGYFYDLCILRFILIIILISLVGKYRNTILSLLCLLSGMFIWLNIGNLLQLRSKLLAFSINLYIYFIFTIIIIEFVLQLLSEDRIKRLSMNQGSL